MDSSSKKKMLVDGIVFLAYRLVPKESVLYFILIDTEDTAMNKDKTNEISVASNIECFDELPNYLT
jgi:hypothetical protein